MDWYLKVIQNYIGFEGRARRKEYWMYTLYNVIFVFGFFVISSIITWLTSSIALGFVFYGIYVLYALAIILPSIAVGVRRLHDIGQSGWLMLIGLIPLVGGIILLILFIQEGKPGSNEWGPNPKELDTTF